MAIALTIRIVSTIGKPVDEPELISLEMTASEAPNSLLENSIRQQAQSWFARIDEVSDGLIRGVIPVS